MMVYDDWKYVIDKIVNSKFVISESLHGLIVAEAYGIPAVWVEFVEHNVEWKFKYLDFYESIGKCDMESIKLYNGFDIGKLMKKKEQWIKGKLEFKEMLNYFPFEIRNELLNKDYL